MAQSKVVLLFIVLVSLCFMNTNSQLTFTPNWGKRGGDAAGSSLSGAQLVGNSMYGAADNNCKTSMDSMLIIYRLIQTEAQRVMACNGK